MPLVVAFVSQKGGVGKSTLARGLATFAVRNGWEDPGRHLDHQQKTSMVWAATRARQDVKPALDVEVYAHVLDAVNAAKTSDLLILDLAGKLLTAPLKRLDMLSFWCSQPAPVRMTATSRFWYFSRWSGRELDVKSLHFPYAAFSPALRKICSFISSKLWLFRARELDSGAPRLPRGNAGRSFDN